ncbi:MAG TPA: translation elongation factor 4, partial [Nitrospirota bacterium]|nr:translation elongation factor 4 [Nitrospirota bacterium]
MASTNIRNFCIIAHIDHGKSTLADRILEYTGALSDREMAAAGTDQVLDDMDLERERGITIKAHAVRLRYTASDGREYILNLIDTPGHVDFTYEVSRSMAACEGALLVVDASQGVEAQTLANAYLAIDHNLEMIPVINKIDLPSANIEEVKRQIEDVVGLDASGAIPASAKEGIGTKEILEAVVKHVPSPAGNADAPLRALLFDSWYDTYQGVVILVRVVDGSVRPKQKIQLYSNAAVYEVQSVGVFTPKMQQKSELSQGEVGCIIAGIKRVSDAKIGDTIMDADRPADAPLPGYKDVKPMVFAGIYPVVSEAYADLRDALEKLRLNDSSFSYEPETSLALGFGFRCGFLGLLHMDIVKERLEREFKLDLIPTAPTVVYRVTTNKGEIVMVDNPAKLPNAQDIQRIEEPIIMASLITPEQYVGSLIALCQERRGVQKEITYITKDRVLLTYELPLNEIVMDFYDKL